MKKRRKTKGLRARRPDDRRLAADQVRNLGVRSALGAFDSPFIGVCAHRRKDGSRCMRVPSKFKGTNGLCHLHAGRLLPPAEERDTTLRRGRLTHVSRRARNRAITKMSERVRNAPLELRQTQAWQALTLVSAPLNWFARLVEAWDVRHHDTGYAWRTEIATLHRMGYL